MGSFARGPCCRATDIDICRFVPKIWGVVFQLTRGNTMGVCLFASVGATPMKHMK